MSFWVMLFGFNLELFIVNLQFNNYYWMRYCKKLFIFSVDSGKKLYVCNEYNGKKLQK
jgi:hypothetical protein